MPTAAAVVACVLLALLAVFQLALTVGAPWARYAWGGGHERLPARLRVGSAVSILLYGVMALVLLDRADVVDVLPGAASRIGAWVLVAYFALATIMNAASSSVRERAVMTPVSVLLLGCSLAVALG